jgi:hypothetical protein
MSVAAPYWPQKYRAEREACGRELTAELLDISDDIDDPVIKLQFLRGALDGQGSYEQRVQRVPFGPIRRALFRLHGLRALAPALANADVESQEIVHYRMLAARTRVRRLLGGVAVVGALLVMPVLTVGLAWQWSSSAAQRTVVAAPSAPAPAPAQIAVSAAAPRESASAPAIQPVVLETPVMPAPPPVAEFLAEESESLALTPSTIFEADRGKGWEVYSNGLRIETSSTVSGKARTYRVADRNGAVRPERYTLPVGILFHTSESDLWAIEPKNQGRLRESSAQVLNYVQQAKSYNYLIDRFGRVYRVVADETVAKHAGNAVWGQGDDVYLDLNAAFIGISFESRWQAPEGESPEGRALPITRAQLIAGRNLTNYLRQRFGIAPEMCVTHGLTSVSPRSFLIGYHRDWATGFPFAAFGLPDQYDKPPASVLLFGFTYDQDYVRAVGKLSPGLITAERMLMKEAQARGITLDAVRQERRARYETLRAQLTGRPAAKKRAPIQQVAVK